MSEKGRRFADEHKIIEFKSAEQQEDYSSDDKFNNDKRLKDKNAKKLKKLLKKQKRIEKRNRRKFPDEEDKQENTKEEPASEDFSEDETLRDEEDLKSNDAPDEPDNSSTSGLESEAGEPESENEDRDDRSMQHAVEDVPRKKKKFPVKRIIAVVVIVVLLFSVVFYVFNRDRFSFHNIANFFKYGVLNQNSEQKFPLDIKGEHVNAGNFLSVGQDICYSSDTKTTMLNNYGRTMFTAQHAFINPVLAVGDQGALVYNLGGTGYQLIDKEGTVSGGEASDHLLTADYADNGIYALVTQSSGYLSKLYVYNEKNEQIFAYSFADYYITSVSLNSSGSRAVLSGVTALNGSENAALYVLDFTQEKPLHFVEAGNDIIYKVRYLTDKYVCAVGRGASYVLNTSNADLRTNSYDGRKLTAFDINSDTNSYTISLSSSGDGRNCDILSYSVTGETENSFSVDKNIISLSSFKGRVALMSSDAVLLYAKDGKALSEKKLTSDPHAVVMYTSSDAYILCTGYIDSVSL